MAEIQSRVSERAGQLEGYFERLRAITTPVSVPKDFAGVNTSLGAANQLYEQLRAALHGSEQSWPEGINLAVLARVPGASRSWASPKRWVASAMRLLFRRQEQFNMEVLRCLNGLAHAQHFDDHLAVTVRLVAAFNSMAIMAMEADRLLAEFSRQLMGWLTSVMDYLDPHLDRDGGTLPDQELARQPGALSAALARNEVAEVARQMSSALGDIAGLRVQIDELATLSASQASALATRIDLIERGQAGLEQRLEDHAATLDRIEHTLADLQAHLASIARRPQTLPATAPASAAAGAAASPDDLLLENFNFYDFEEETRGAESVIAGEQRRYLSWFEGATNVLDAGCGRGEFLELLHTQGVDAYGIDSDENMVAHCLGKHLNVEHAGLFEHLQGVADNSLGGIFLGMVIEHLPVAALAALPGLAMRKLKPGAAIVMETINPTCLTTFSGAFYADPTHVRPVHPKTAEFFLGSAGFTDVTTMYTAPIPESGRLVMLKESAPLDPPLRELLATMNENLQKLNSVLYSYGNYATAGRKPAGA